MFSTFITAFAVLASVSASANEWSKGTHLDASHHVSFKVDLQQSGLDKLNETFMRVSDPRDKLFRKYLTREQVTEMISPSESNLNIVKSWLGCDSFHKFDDNSVETFRNGKPNCRLSTHKDYVYVTMTVEQVEKFFHVKLLQHNTQVGKNTISIIRSDGKVSVPLNLKHIVRRVDGISGPLPPMELLTARIHQEMSNSNNKVQKNRVLKKEPGDEITPPVIWGLYGLESSLPFDSKVTSKSSMSCAEFQGEEFLPSDTEMFETLWDLPRVVPSITGANNGGYYGEGSMDVEYMVGTAPGVPITWWGNVWGTAFTSDVFEWTQKVVNAKNPPLVHSVSWGSAESIAVGYDLQTVEDVNTNFQIMGVTGLTVLIASGDHGTSATNAKCKRFDSWWPASSPYVTAVGGTYLNSDENNKKSEVAWVGSGGGFSETFSQPSYQTDAVNNYLTKSSNDGDLPDSSLFNANGRAIPDISAVSTNFLAISWATNYTVSGTSASTPVVSGLMSLLNAQLLSENKAPLGFINPSLYSLYSTSSPGTDIVEGNNLYGACESGFSAKEGWDAITGLGTPNWTILQKLMNPAQN